MSLKVMFREQMPDGNWTEYPYTLSDRQVRQIALDLQSRGLHRAAIIGYFVSMGNSTGDTRQVLDRVMPAVSTRMTA